MHRLSVVCGAFIDECTSCSVTNGTTICSVCDNSKVISTTGTACVSKLKVIKKNTLMIFCMYVMCFVILV